MSSVVYMGKVASANQVMKDGVMRKQRTEELSVDCFEMEAAGLMETARGVKWVTSTTVR